MSPWPAPNSNYHRFGMGALRNRNGLSGMQAMIISHNCKVLLYRIFLLNCFPSLLDPCILQVRVCNLVSLSLSLSLSLSCIPNKSQISGDLCVIKQLKSANSECRWRRHPFGQACRLVESKGPQNLAKTVMCSFWFPREEVDPARFTHGKKYWNWNPLVPSLEHPNFEIPWNSPQKSLLHTQHQPVIAVGWHFVLRSTA